MDNQQSTPGEQAPLSKLALWSAILGVVGVCIFPLALVGAGLGIAALVAMSKNRALRGKNLALAGLVLPAFSIVTSGILAAIAIPAFIQYTKRAKVQEARMNMVVLSDLIENYASEPRPTLDGSNVPHLPPSIPPTPTIPTNARQEWPANASPGWADLGFRPASPVYYSYEIRTSPDGRHCVVRAVGDLDGDGTFSKFEVHAELLPDGLSIGPTQIENEYE